MPKSLPEPSTDISAMASAFPFHTVEEDCSSEEVSSELLSSDDIGEELGEGRKSKQCFRNDGLTDDRERLETMLALQSSACLQVLNATTVEFEQLKECIPLVSNRLGSEEDYLLIIFPSKRQWYTDDDDQSFPDPFFLDQEEEKWIRRAIVMLRRPLKHRKSGRSKKYRSKTVRETGSTGVPTISEYEDRLRGAHADELLRQHVSNQSMDFDCSELEPKSVSFSQKTCIREYWEADDGKVICNDSEVTTDKGILVAN